MIDYSNRFLDLFLRSEDIDYSTDQHHDDMIFCGYVKFEKVHMFMSFIDFSDQFLCAFSKKNICTYLNLRSSER